MFLRVSQEYVNSALLTACLHWFPWDPEPLVLVPRGTIPLLPNDSESLPKVCYINLKKVSEILSRVNALPGIPHASFEGRHEIFGPVENQNMRRPYRSE